MVIQTMSKGSRGMSKTTSAYGKMLVVAFGLAVIGVMVVHKLRERRILNLIVEDKDQQLISIHLLLQREMDLNKEMSSKIDDLKPRLHILRSQKMELNRRVMELQSTITSLKNDIKFMESNLHIKNKKNKMLKDKITQILKEKTDELEQLKQVNGRSTNDQFLNSTIKTDHKDVEENVKNVTMSEKIEFKDVPDELISSMETMTNKDNYDRVENLKEDTLLDSEANENGNGSSELENKEHDQDDQNSHSENDDDDEGRQETDTEEHNAIEEE